MIREIAEGVDLKVFSFSILKRSNKKVVRADLFARARVRLARHSLLKILHQQHFTKVSSKLALRQGGVRN